MKKVNQRSSSPRSSRATLGSLAPVGIGLLLAIVLISLACNLPTALGLKMPGSATATPPMSLQEALAVPPRDDRPEILKQMGYPDAFRIIFEDLGSQTVRREEWSYFDEQTRFDFIDGTLVDTARIVPTPNGTIFASYYDPSAFQAYMTLGQVQALFPDQKLLQVDAAQAGVSGGLVVAGNQILMGFDQGQLVYVETLVLTPEGKS
ncbi:MAG: hypothetical protein ABSG98_06500 [Anaerolineales bacterium]|jgi:hypothetical protein